MQQQLPARWRKAQLSDLVSLRRDTIHPDDAVDLKYVGLEHIDPGNTELLRWGEAHQVTSTKNRFYPGDIIYGKLRPYLDKAVLVNDKGICSTDILVFKPQEVALSEFVAYLVHTQHFINHAMATTTGVNHPRTSWRGLSTFPVFLPPLEEQRVITAVLRTVQEAIAARRREAALERERKAALMQRLFTYGTRGERLKDTAVGRIPESWKVKTIEQLCQLIVDCPHTTPKFAGSGVLVVRNFNLKEGHLNLDSASYTSEEEYIERTKRAEPISGDVLFSREAPVGEACLVPDNQKLSLGQRMMQLRIIPDKLHNMFLVYTIYSENTRRRMMALAKGVTAKHLNVRDVRDLKIPLPTLAEQLRITELLCSCDDKIAALEKESVLLNELFQALLEELMSGRLFKVTPIVKTTNRQN